MKRRHLLRGSGSVLVPVGLVGLAGCTGGGDGSDGGDGGDASGGSDGGDAGGGDGGDGSDATDGGDETTTTTTATATESTTTADDGSEDGEQVKEDIGEVEENAVGGLDVVGWTSESQPENGLFQIRLVVENVGDEPTGLSAREYTFETPVYDESGSELDASQAGYAIEKLEVASGETSWMITGASLDDPGQVASYGIRVTCGPDDTGAYCE